MSKINTQRAQELREAVRHLLRALGVLNDPYSREGLHLTQCHALVELELQPNLNIIRLAQLLNLERSSVSRLVKQLQKLGLVEYISDPTDKRSKLLHLTTQGMSCVQKIHLENNTRIKPAVASLSENQYQIILQGIRIYADTLKNNCPLLNF